MDLNHARLPIPPLRHSVAGGAVRGALARERACLSIRLAKRIVTQPPRPRPSYASPRRAFLCRAHRVRAMMPDELEVPACAWPAPSRTPTSDAKDRFNASAGYGRESPNSPAAQHPVCALSPTISATPSRPSPRPPTSSPRPRSTRPTGNGWNWWRTPPATPSASTARSATSCAPTPPASDARCHPDPAEREKRESRRTSHPSSSWAARSGFCIPGTLLFHIGCHADPAKPEKHPAPPPHWLSS